MENSFRTARVRRVRRGARKRPWGPGVRRRLVQASVDAGAGRWARPPARL